MAKKKNIKKQALKTAKKVHKQNPKGFWIAISVALVIALVGAAAYFLLKSLGYLPERNDSSSQTSQHASSTYTSLQGDCDPISFHFIDREEEYSGDSIYIKAGENDILIDAGAKKGSAVAIENYIEDSSRGSSCVSDGKLEYVFVTHAHQDHIAGMVGSKDSKTGIRNGILTHYQIDNLIDFSYVDSSDAKSVIRNADPSNSKGDSDFVGYKDTYTKSGKETAHSTVIYQEYVEAREEAVGNGTLWKTAEQLFDEKGSFSYKVSLGKNLTMELLYSFFYDHTSAQVDQLESAYKRSSFSDQNDYSLSILFTQGSRHFLFTGDGEEYSEHSLVKFNSLPHVDLFKAGHHGSYTASGSELLSAITPSMCVVTCCAGNKEYASDANHSFPAQEFIDRIALYTDRVYVTTLGSWEDKSHHEAFNGNIVCAYSSESQEDVTFSNNDLKLKDSPWMKQNRTMPSSWA